MRVLITGAAGFIGSHLCDRFLREGHEVIGLDNFLTGSPDNVSHLFGNPNFRFFKYDVTNFIYLEGELDLILHFACPASPVDYMNHPIHTMKVDSMGTLHTLGLAKLKGARYVFASTSEVYGNPEVHPQPETYWGRVNPIGPRSVYDEAKRFSEALTMAYHREHGIDTRIARIFNTYGPRMRVNDGRVVPNFIYQAITGKPLTVYGDGSQTRSFCYIDDLVEGIYRLAIEEGLSGEVFNLGNPTEHTILDLAKLIIDIAGSPSEIVFTDRPVDDPDRRKPDITKAKKVIGWEPETSIEEGLKRTVNWFREKLVAG
ncbi:UDP-glucuronic acid decarboxylase family protein [Hydrogenivirga sp. 128-5-R1-1]|uniref:UDP-glucuronic acid decarboxylase family protein n=1 Tax=Hydrogenivirga sp. 128-5-R1-1 TaxID=392423 RepID=UPI00015F36A4|nr:UDP-glucuronic acid decarboxylase family protein [Hydrogenivirga sp. 128-5-R1-1]EDP76315.1 UDP-glucuronate decarboxylase [Hydrogenivirga sp. 128-5-R1-1]